MFNDSGPNIPALPTTLPLNSYVVNKFLDSIEISDYNKRYFGSLIKNKQSLNLNLDKYSYLLKLALSKYDYNENCKPIFLD